jgi:hypothetical protein
MTCNVVREHLVLNVPETSLHNMMITNKSTKTPSGAMLTSGGTSRSLL